MMNAKEKLAALVGRREQFLRFLTRQVRDPATAEDLLQEALLKSIDHLDELRDEAALEAWFYRVLENAALDHHRRNSASSRALERVEHEVARAQAEATASFDDAPARTCKCVAKLKAGLKQPYAQALERVEVDEVAVKDFAQEEGITANNAAVRVFRAREALRQRVEATCGHCAQAGCQDCTCGS